MKNRITEIVELGKPQSIIQREGAPITELIHTHILIEELNEQLLLYNVMCQREQLFAYEKMRTSHIIGATDEWRYENVDLFLANNCT